MQLNPLWDAGFLVAILLTARWYWRASEKARVTSWRRFSFLAGLVGLAIILVGPLAHAAVRDFWVHMVQHVSIMMVLSPALVLGAPLAVAAGSDDRVSLLLKQGVNCRAARFLLQPRVGWVLFAGTILLTHYSVLADIAMRNADVHSLVLVLYLFAGLVFYFPLLDGNPLPLSVPHAVRFGSLLAMMVPETMTGFFMYASSSMLHALPPGTQSESMPDMAGMSPLTDQRVGGAIMWGVGMLIDAIWVAIAMRDWLADERRRSMAEDAAIRAQEGAAADGA